MKNLIFKIKNTLEEIAFMYDEAEDQINDQENKVERNNQVEQLHEKETQKNIKIA